MLQTAFHQVFRGHLLAKSIGFLKPFHYLVGKPRYNLPLPSKTPAITSTIVEMAMEREVSINTTVKP